MGLKMLHPQEVEVFYILPAVRKEFAKTFKKEGRKQSDIAKIMGVTEAAVSQYLSNKRADIVLDKPTLAQIAKVSKTIKTQDQFVFASQSILNDMLKSKATCDIHHRVNAEIGHDCKTCFECR